jgi:hypothetical protein
MTILAEPFVKAYSYQVVQMGEWFIEVVNIRLQAIPLQQVVSHLG